MATNALRAVKGVLVRRAWACTRSVRLGGERACAGIGRCAQHAAGRSRNSGSERVLCTGYGVP